MRLRNAITLSLRSAALAAAILVAVGGTLAAQNGPREVPGRLAADSSGAAALVVGVDTVLFVPAGYGAYSAMQRAEAIKARLRLASVSRVDSLVLVRNESSTDILAGETILMSVTERDAAAVGMPRDSLARECRDALSAEINAMSWGETARALAYGGLLTLLATVVLIGLLALLKRAMKRAENTLERWATGSTARLTSLKLLTPDQVRAGTTGALRSLRLVVIALLLYLYLPLVLEFFPWTEPYGNQLLSYVLDPLSRVFWGFLEFLPSLAFIVVIVLVARYALAAIKALFAAIERGALSFDGFEREWADPTYKIVRFLVIAFVLVVVFPYLPGSSSEAFRGVSIFLGLLVSLGSSSAIANVIAGTVLTYTRAFSLGDHVQIGDTIGDVVARSLLVTRVRTIKNVDVTIPNAMVLSSHVLNYSATAKTTGLVLHTSVTIGYDAPWAQVHELLIAAARDVPGVLAEPKPFVLQTALGDFAVAYELNAYTRDAAAQATLYSDLHQRIQDRFNAAGVEIMSPNYLALRDGNDVTLPPSSRPAGYVTPSFRVAAKDS